ncbi:MAG: hypothetical protein HYZ75_13500 [Elusimicrobia bacterium]|nr:hypothetical protein [Elusimicrobiota bacterium]
MRLLLLAALLVTARADDGPRMGSIAAIIKDARARAEKMAPEAKLYGIAMKRDNWHLSFHEVRTFRQLVFTYHAGELMDFELRQVRPPEKGTVVADGSTDRIAHFMSTRGQPEAAVERMRKRLRNGTWWKPGPARDVRMKPYYRQACDAIGKDFMDASELKTLLERRGVILSREAAGDDVRLLLFHPSPKQPGCLALFDDPSLLPSVRNYPLEVSGKDVWVLQTARLRLFLDARDGTLLWTMPPGAGE